MLTNDIDGLVRELSEPIAGQRWQYSGKKSVTNFTIKIVPVNGSENGVEEKAIIKVLED